MKTLKIKKISLCALFSAIIAAAAFIFIPTPFGVNLTMQIFAVCLAGFCLGAKGGFAAVFVYLLIGAMGLPIFSSFSGGIGVLFGTSGGFLWGFLAVALLCGISTKIDKKPLKTLVCTISVLLCHTIGVVQYSVVSGIGLWAAFLSASLPFLLKDFMVLFLAQLTAKKLKNMIKG